MLLHRESLAIALQMLSILILSYSLLSLHLIFFLSFSYLFPLPSSSFFSLFSPFILFYCCPLKLRPSRARVCMHMQASKNKKLGWLLFEESALFGNFAATKQTSLPKHGQRYTFSRTADTKSATKLLQQAKNSSNQPRIGWREVCKDV